MLKFKIAQIRISERHTQQVIVAEWELPILQAMHADVQETGETLVNRKPPGAEDEFNRLVNRYKSVVNEDGSKGLPYAVSVYGQFGVGTKALERAIAAATVETPAEGPYQTIDISDLLGGIEV